LPQRRNVAVGKVAEFVLQGFKNYVQEFPEIICPGLTLHGPCLEGVGKQRLAAFYIILLMIFCIL
jgi:hypothetical protein